MEKIVILQIASMPFIVKFICHMFVTGVSHAVMASATAVVGKGSCILADIPWLPLLKKLWQQRPSLQNIVALIT